MDKPDMTKDAKRSIDRLRDEFAGQALTGMLAAEDGEFAYEEKDAAKRAYALADAMLEARSDEQ